MKISATQFELNITGEQTSSEKRARFDDSIINSLSKASASNAELAINNGYAGEHILIDIYRRHALDKETINSLYHTSSLIQNYVINHENYNIKNGRIGHNTFAAIAACDKLKKYSLDMNFDDLVLLKSNPLGNELHPRLNNKQISSFFALAEKDESSRTIEMLANAGVIYCDLFKADFGSLSEEQYHPAINAYDTQSKEFEILFNRDLEIIKTDCFLRDWAIFGFSAKPECQLKFMGKYINYTYSDLTYEEFKGCNFTAVNLTGSRAEGCNFYDCNFIDTVLNGVTMYETFFFNREGLDYDTAQSLTNNGVTGINMCDYVTGIDFDNYVPL